MRRACPQFDLARAPALALAHRLTASTQPIAHVLPLLRTELPPASQAVQEALTLLRAHRVHLADHLAKLGPVPLAQVTVPFEASSDRVLLWRGESSKAAVPLPEFLAAALR